MGAIQWLILCGAALVLAIALGTAYLAMQYRERAIKTAERDLTNTALLLSRHFDQQLSDLQHVHEDVITLVRAGGIDSAESFEHRRPCSKSFVAIARRERHDTLRAHDRPRVHARPEHALQSRLDVTHAAQRRA